MGPGFRFHPTDEELVVYYLRRKVRRKPFHVEAIAVVDIYKHEPWELHVDSREAEWHFFTRTEKKYINGSKINRATINGFWKATGRDRAVHHKSQIVGLKKTLVYHAGRAPAGKRTDWLMHEYRLSEQELDKAGVQQVDLNLIIIQFNSIHNFILINFLYLISFLFWELRMNNLNEIPFFN
nr:NAC domain-containing protein 78-like [Ipomoea batatas]